MSQRNHTRLTLGGLYKYDVELYGDTDGHCAKCNGPGPVLAIDMGTGEYGVELCLRCVRAILGTSDEQFVKSDPVRFEWERRARALWGLLDDIDTLDDACREHDGEFRTRARAAQKKRWAIFRPDNEPWDPDEEKSP